MQITTHYTGNLKRTYRASARLHRRADLRSYRLGGLFVLLAVLAVAARLPEYIITVLAVFGVLLLAIPAMVWLKLRSFRAAIEVDIDVEVTDHGISYKTATQTIQATWGMIQRVIDSDEFWIFVINQRQAVALPKPHLTPNQRAELTAFLASHPRSPA